ncbi:stereocilin [Neoarius graeffei]|uniref:stereocilin n=1 Tax=Neoarius graeffei TaxID=443677 RepID=UPI00298CF909|nr:stereocilin [Neoarius graeffei]
MTDLALCADLDTADFVNKVCANSTVLRNLLANLDNTWLLEQCSNLTGSGRENLMGFKPSEQCLYANWTVTLPDTALLALCWDYDQANFISSICVKPAVLSPIIQDPSNLWVSALCATCSNYTKVSQSNNTNSSSSSNNMNTTELYPCLVKEMIVRLNWSCSIDLNTICQPDIPQLQVFQAFLLCGMEVLLLHMEKTMTTEVASVVRQATSLWTILLLVLEENGMTTLRVTDHIGQSVLDSVSGFLEKETSFSKKQVLLQCFAKILTSLMQTGRDVTSDVSFFIEQYFQIPLARLRAVLSSVDMNTMRLIVRYYNQNQENLQLSEDYLRTMVSVLIQIHLRQDKTLFFNLGPLLRLAKPEDISSLPPLQTNIIVLKLINSTIGSLSPEQCQAFGSWFSQSLSSANVMAGGPSFIQDSGNLIAYLPFRSFQHLSPPQVLNGLDVLLRNDLGAVKQQFVAQSVIGVYKNLTEEQFRRLAKLTCQANVSDLLAYVDTSMFPVIQENIRTCITQGMSVPSTLISSVLFLNGSELQSPAALSPQKVCQLAPLLPLLGSGFLQQLSQSQLVPAFTALTSVPFTPTQAAVIIDKISSSLNLFDAGTLAKFGSLLSGLRAETLSAMSSSVLLSAVSNFSQYTPELTPPQVNAITTQLWAASKPVTWLDEAEPLLSDTPLMSVIPQTRHLLTSNTPYTHTWNTQQAKTLFNEVMSSSSSLTVQRFMSLGTIAQGVSCNVLTTLFQNSTSVSSKHDLLQVLKEQPVPLHPSLKRCLIEEVYKSNLFSELLGEMGAQIALSIPMSTIKRFSTEMMDSLRRMIILDPQYFLLMPRIKLTMLVDRMVQNLGLNTGTYTEVEFRSLGIMATFVVDAVFMQLDRRFFVDSIEFLRGFCYDASKRDAMASMLQEAGTFGPVQTWNTTTLIQVDRFLFFLPQEIIQLIPPALMSLERVERLLSSQKQWESGDVGSLCERGDDDDALLFKKQFVLQYFLASQLQQALSRSASSTLPSCESVQVTGPPVWPVSSLANMSSSAFRQCLELLGQDPSFTSDQLSLLLHKTKEVYGAVSSFTPSVIAQLGHIATQLSLDELALLRLSEILAIAPLGAVSTWTRKQLGVLFSTVLKVTKQTPNQLNSTSLVALGHIVCGIEAPVMNTLNPVEFSKAVLWLGRLNLSCSEDQLQAVVSLLSHRLVFGSISSWGPEVFLEIGAFAAGVPDVAMSALVKEQIEGIAPLAISLITATKFAVVFNQAQISVFSYEQAVAVTAAQRSALSPVQLTALSMVLNPLEDKPVDFRGRSFGVTAEVCPFCHVCSLLVFVLTLVFNICP